MGKRNIILVTNKIHDEVAERLSVCGELVMNSTGQPWSAEELAQRAKQATAMMGFMTDRVDAVFLAAAPQLKIVACALKGYDSYDASACARAGVWLSIVPDLLTEPTAELAIGLAISLARNVRHGDHLIRTSTYRGWRPSLYGVGLKDACVVVIGAGRVGSAIIDRLAGFGCASILSVDPQRQHGSASATELDTALTQADFVFVAAPLTASSCHLLGEAQLQLCKPGQFIVNVGRGSVVDEEAMISALASGHLGGYAADVFACEDWGLENHPDTIPVGLLDAPNTLLTPHLGSAVARVRLAIEHRAADNIVAVLEGKIPPDAIAGPAGNAVSTAQAG